MKKLTLFLVAILAMVNVANAQRAWAYDLGLTSESESYTFTFKAVTAANATLVFYQDGDEAGTLNLGSVAAGQNTVTKTSAELLSAIQKSGDFTWGVTMTGSAIVKSGTYVTEITAAGQGLDFYLPQGLVVDNNPESGTFSSIFIAEAQGGKLSVGPTHTQGIYHYSQTLAELNTTDKGIIPSNVTLTNGSRQEMHRIAINPKNNHVAFALNVSGKAAVWSVPANNPAGEATNLIAGTSITMPNSICFDENGALYVMDNANATTGGTLYKVVDGVATKLAQNKTWQEVDNSLAYDGRGGVWIAQTSTSNTWPSYAILSHVNSKGEIDWSALDHSSEGLFSAGNSYGYSQRGQCAYNPKEDLLVLGGNCRSHIFQVSYAAGTGKPSLTLKYQTSFIKAKTNIDGAAFDYAGDLYLMSAARERLYKYAIPTNNNTCTTPAPKAQTITLVETKQYTITATSADDNMGIVTGSGTYYEGETVTLKAVAKNTYYFVNWSDGNTDATRTFIAAADVELTANFAKAFPRTWAYDLTLSEDGDNYKFTFTTTSEGTATIHFNDREGNKLYESHSAGVIEAGTHNVLIDKTYFPQNKDVYWSVQMDGAEIPVIAEVTDQSRGIYDFYNMMGVVVDNDPESPYFSDIYIQQSLQYTSGSTAERNKTQTSGIYIYDQGLNEMNSPANTGIQPQLPYALGGNRQNFKRLTINPTNRHLAFCNNVAGSGAVYSVGMDNLTALANNLISHIDEIDNANALCFDKDGNLYVVANVVTNYTDGDIYKIASDGTYTKITPLRPDGKKIWVDEEIAIASDRRGGVWVAQKRDGITQYSALFHVNFEQSKVDFVLEEGQDYSDWFTGTNRRGAIAYDEQRDILAVHGPSAASLFSVAYDGEGVPTITKFAQTHNIGSSNIDGLAFDYAGDLYLVSSGTEKFYKFAVPTNNNTCTTPASQNQIIKKEIWYDVIVNINDNTMGTVNGAGSYLENSQATLTATPTANHRFVNWKEGETILSTSTNYAFTVTKETTLTATFEPIPQYTINVTYDNTMGTVTGDGTYYEGTEVTLTAKANGGYVFVKWGDEVTDESRTFTAGVDLPETLTATFKAAVPRAWAYDLRQVENGENYEFTFKTTSAGTATLIFKDKDGNIQDFGAHTIDATAAEEKTIKIAKSTFEDATKDIYWEVELAGEAIAKMAEITDPTEGIYNFYVPQGVAVDNSPNSMYFGRIYVAEGTTGANDGGSEMAKQMTAGLFVYNQALEKVQPATGYTGIIPQNVTFNTNKPTSTDEINIIRQQMHRVAVDPVTGEVAFAYYKSPATAIYSMNPDDLAGNAQNLIEGSSITYANSLCFDSEGTLYVMNNANTGLTGGQIYKVQDDEVTLFAAHDKNNQWAVYDNAMAADGRGGLWIAQNRYAYTPYPILTHVNKDGIVDFAVTENLNDWFPNNNTGSSYRGQLAYNLNENILAFAGNKMVTLFTVEYDGNGKPTINKLMSTPLLGGNIDGVAFDYAGDLYAASASSERLYKFVVPTNTNTCTVPAPKSQAIIKEVRYTVTVNTVGNGSATGAGEYVVGETATLEASPAAHHKFVNWTYGSETSTNNPLELVVDGDITVTANFEPVQYTLIAPTNDENKGTVSGAGAYNYGTEVTLTATPKDGYKLLYWSDRSTENPRTITMTKNEAISAYFVKEYDEEPTFKIEKIWENTNVPASTSNGYQAVGWDGKIYMQNRTAGKIITYSSAEDTGTDYATSGSGQQIAVDEAGNLIVFNATFSTANPNAILIYQKGSTEGKAVSFTLKDPARCDFFSASGDIYSPEGGYVYFYCAGKTVINRLKITNGAATTFDVTTDVVGESVYSSPQNTNYVMVDIFGNLVAHARSNAVNVINVHTNESKAFTLPNIKMGTLGGCSFELGGKELWAYHAGASNYSSEWNIYNMTDSKFLSDDDFYAFDKSATTNYACNWLNVQVVDENTAYIYQFCPLKAMAIWKVTLERDDLREFTVTATANDPAMGTVTGEGTYYEDATATLTATANTGYRFVNWTKGEEVVSTDKTYTFTVTENVTLTANFEKIPEIAYELNGGVWNKYGWTSKKDMYDAFVAEWKTYSSSGQSFCSYETQLGIGNSNQGLPTAILSTQPILEFMAQAKWAWLGQFLDALATAQGKATKPTEAVLQMRFGLGNFFGEDNNGAGASSWIGAVDCSGDIASITAFAPYWGQTFPMPTQPTEEIVLNAPYKEGCEFGGWYANSDFSGAAVTAVDENTDGTLYAKWKETIITVTIDENANNTAALAPYEGETVTATVTRNFGANKILTVTLPFDMNATQIRNVFGNATVYEFYNVVDADEELYLQFTHTNSIEAGKPYIIQTAASGYDAEDGFTIEDVTINTEPTHVKRGDITMVPVLDGGGTLNQPTQYYLSNNALYCAGDHNNDRQLPGLRAFFTSATSTPIRARVIFDDNGATSIPTVIAPETKAQKIIKDGRLIIIRGEHQYNAQGQMIE